MNNLEELKKKYEELGNEIKRLEQQKNKRWRGKVDEYYYFIDNNGKICNGIEDNYIIDDFRYKTRNYFRTEKEAQEHLDNINTYYELMDLAEELNNGEDIDWSDSDQDKYFILYNFDDKQLDYECNYIYKEPGKIYCLNQNFLDIAIDRIGEDRLIKLIKG